MKTPPSSSRPGGRVVAQPIDEGSPIDPVSFLKSFVSLRLLTGMYPAGHPVIEQKLKELEGIIRAHLRMRPALRIDIIRGDVHLDGLPFRHEPQTSVEIFRELIDLGIESIHVEQGFQAAELQAVAQFLWLVKERPTGEPIEAQLARHGVRHISLGRIVPLDTRWRTQRWPEAPTGPLDPAYAESLRLAEATFEHVAAGRRVDPVTVREVIQLLIYRVARSNAALAHILAVKQYENLTYCHSVNVAMLSLLLGRRLNLDEPTMNALVEAALLHDIGKTRVPLEIVKKPGALDKRERKLIEAHTVFGAEILVENEDLRPLTPTVALEHHRGTKGSGYPDLGEGVIPHLLSQIVSVADIYEAITGARSYQPPRLPEQACLLLARLAGDTLNTALVKTFINAITFFPVGSLVRTSRGEIGIVVRTSSSDPLHPVISLLDDGLETTRGEIDTSMRDSSGTYDRHIVETLKPNGGLNLTKLFAQSPTAA